MDAMTYVGMSTTRRLWFRISLAAWSIAAAVGAVRIILWVMHG